MGSLYAKRRPVPRDKLQCRSEPQLFRYRDPGDPARRVPGVLSVQHPDSASQCPSGHL